MTGQILKFLLNTMHLLQRLLRLIRIRLLCLQAVRLFTFRGLIMLRLCLIQVLAARQGALLLQIYLQAKLTQAVKQQKHIRFHLKKILFTEIIPVSLLFRSIRKAFMSAIVIMTRLKRMFCSRSATDFHTQPLNTVILSFLQARLRIQIRLRFPLKSRIQAV